MIFRRKKRDDTSARYGYEDRAALKGVGGYEPADADDAYRPQSPPAPDLSAHHPEVHRPTTPYPGAAGPKPHDPATSASSWPSGTQQPATQSPAQQQPSTQQPAQQHPPTQGPAQQPAAPGSGGPVPPPRVKTSPRGAGRKRSIGWIPVLVVGAAMWGVPQLFPEDDSSARVDSSDPTSEPAPPPTTRVTVPAAVDGWQSVVGGDGAYAYDVPPSWQPDQGVVHGWEAGGGYDDRFALSASAFVGKECDDATHAGGAGVTSDDRPLEAAARALVDEVSGRAYTEEGGAKPRVQVLSEDAGPLTRGDREAGRSRSMIAAASPAESGGCVPERALVGTRAVAAGEDGGVVALVVYADANLATQEDVRRILDSLRAVPESERTTVTVTPTG